MIVKLKAKHRGQVIFKVQRRAKKKGRAAL